MQPAAPYQFVLPTPAQVPGLRNDKTARRRFGVLLNIAMQFTDHSGKPFAEVKFKGKGGRQPDAAFQSAVTMACTAQGWYAAWHRDQETGYHTVFVALERDPVDRKIASLTAQPSA